ncbi:MAG: hypothetical protein OXQ94_07280 [Gemmatimonadota bacterium]|nr:hypothetical protein [Gemmatimonadota bacterium]
MKHPLRWLPASALGLCVAAPDLTARQQDFGDRWVSHPEFEIGEGATGTGTAAFGIISTVRIVGDSLVLVAEPMDFRATIWTPGGRLISQVGGPGEGPGEFSRTMFIDVRREEFHVRDARRFTFFSNAGELLGTTPFPPHSLSFRGFGLGPRALLEDGSVFAIPRVPPAAMGGVAGDDPIEMLPVFRLSEERGQWRMDTVAMLDIRNREFSIIPEGRSAAGGGIYTSQPFGDFDLTYFDSVLGTVVVLRRNLGGGLVELVEINADGDTVLQRIVPTSPATLTRDQIASFIDGYTQQLSRPSVSSSPHRAIRAAFEDALYVPDPLPGAREVLGTASGEIWFHGFESEDSFSVWYAVPRDNATSAFRQVLLPPGFSARDATETHVWGVRRGELGVEYVVGRRLVPLATAGESSEGGAAAAQSWTTEPGFRIYAPGDADSGFGRGSRLLVSPDGTRIVVWDAEPVDYTTTIWRILVYSPNGNLVLNMGPDDFSGDPGSLGIVPAVGVSGFLVTDRNRAAWYSYSGGSPVETVAMPRGYGLTLPLAGGGFLGLPSLPSGHSGGRTVLRLPDVDGRRAPDTIAVLDNRNSTFSITLGDPSVPRQPFTTSYSGQPFADDDIWWTDPEAGSIGVVRRSGPPGVAEVFEILASGDTAWHRRLSLPAIPLSPELAESTIAEKVEGLRAQAESYGLTAAQLRSIVKEAIRLPSHLPVVSDVAATASGEVWLRTPEGDDHGAVWYVIRRDDADSEPRRVLLPTSFAFDDAFGDHVWGFSRDPQEPRSILGLRLVPPSSDPRDR